jgi:geranylgeranyl pyrophosphate synthase
MGRAISQATTPLPETAADTAAAPLLSRQLLSPDVFERLAEGAAAVPPAVWNRALRAPVFDILDRPGKGFRGRLTAAAFRLAGGQGDPPAALAAMLEVLHAGSMIIDDIEDGSSERRGGPAVHRRHGLPLALNAGNWMYFAPLQLIPELGLDAEAELHLRRRLGRVLLDCHFGQALDLGARVAEVPRARVQAVAATIATLKTGRLAALAAEAGALCAGADPPLRAAMSALGEDLGVGLQMLDDLGNLSPRTAPARRYEDLRQGRVTWVWAWAAARLDDAAFSELVGQAGDGGCETVAASLRALVVAEGRLQAHAQLHGALASARRRLGSSRTLDELTEAVARLEVAYG